MRTAAPERLARIREVLGARGQGHLLRFYDDLTGPQQEALLDQLEGIDFARLETLIAEPAAEPSTEGLEPAPYHPLVAPNAGDAGALDVRGAGEALIRRGAVAAFTVAGGQGTRLGWRGPKGTYPATPVSGKPLFRCFAEQLLTAERKYGVTIPWYIMTSPANDAETRAFFVDNNCFGLLRTNIMMFPQGTLPSFDPATGRLLLAQRHEVATNPDGHGGALRALRTSGAIEDMRARGIEHISYFQVDNPLVHVIDPYFLGLHGAAPDSSGEMSSKMVVKTDPTEKVGVFVRQDDATRVIEYSNLPEALMTARDADGRLRYRAGSIAIHLLGLEFVARLTADDGASALPLHRARKKVPYVDDAGRIVEPDEPNAIKLETFVFDALPFARSSIVCETDRAEEFAPIKNADGVDSPATAHRLQIDRAGRWLEIHGVEIPRGDDGHALARIEISPLTATEPADLTAVDLPKRIEAGEEVVL